MTLLDGAIILVYMAVVVTAGLLSRGRQASGEDYFTAGGAMQGFLGTAIVGLSVAATFFRGITFVALPSVKARQSDCRLLSRGCARRRRPGSSFPPRA